MERMTYLEAKALPIDTATDAKLVSAWHSCASQISFHHADDSGKEWGLATAIMPRAREIEQEIRKRGLERPTGEYLMSAGDRIDWDTGDWSPGWVWKKRQAQEAGQ